MTTNEVHKLFCMFGELYQDGIHCTSLKLQNGSDMEVVVINVSEDKITLSLTGKYFGRKKKFKECLRFDYLKQLNIDTSKGLLWSFLNYLYEYYYLTTFQNK